MTRCMLQSQVLGAPGEGGGEIIGLNHAHMCMLKNKGNWSFFGFK